MSIYAISDLHLGDQGPRDNFGSARLPTLYRFLDYVRVNRGQLVILGDLFEWWQVNVSASIIAYRELMERLVDMDATYVVGNHDNAFDAFINVGIPLPIIPRPGVPFQKKIAGRLFDFCHGHESDPLCNDANPGLGHLSAIVTGLSEDRHGGPLDRRGRVIEDQIIGFTDRMITAWKRVRFKKSRFQELIQAAELHRTESGADVVIYGHTHSPGQMGDFHYNCGTWAREQNTFVRIVESSGEVEVCEWLDPGIRPFVKFLPKTGIAPK